MEATQMYLLIYLVLSAFNSAVIGLYPKLMPSFEHKLKTTAGECAIGEKEEAIRRLICETMLGAIPVIGTILAYGLIRNLFTARRHHAVK